MESSFPIDTICILIFCLITALSLIAMVRGAKQRAYVNEEGELMELDEIEDVFSEERMQ